MSDRNIYEVQQGETHRVRIASPLASVYVATATATLHRLRGGITSYNSDSTVSETYAVDTFAGDATYGPGFEFELTAAETAALDPGLYVAAPKISYTSPETFVDIPLAWVVNILPYPS